MIQTMMLLQTKTSFTLKFSPSSLSLPNPQFSSFKPSPSTHTLTRRRTLPKLSCAVEEKNQPISKPKSTDSDDLASELKKAMQDRKEKEGNNFLNGVIQEIGEIEWPQFGKVLGTTGVVLSVIFGSGVVLLTVNAILAEISDMAFAGKGIQDFFA